jgi:hypothetical protein
VFPGATDFDELTQGTSQTSGGTQVGFPVRFLESDMRRPLNWLVVSISLLVLCASRMVADPAARAPVPAVTSVSPGLFAYVREDGTMLYLPGSEAPELPLISFEDVHAASGFDHAADMPKRAVFTWSSPLAPAEQPVSHNVARAATRPEAPAIGRRPAVDQCAL